jgi:hypothetical protein
LGSMAFQSSERTVMCRVQRLVNPKNCSGEALEGSGLAAEATAQPTNHPRNTSRCFTEKKTPEGGVWFPDFGAG